MPDEELRETAARPGPARRPRTGDAGDASAVVFLLCPRQAIAQAFDWAVWNSSDTPVKTALVRRHTSPRLAAPRLGSASPAGTWPPQNMNLA